MIWKRQFNLQQLAEMSKTCMLGHLGIEITAFGDDYLEGTMPVDERTKQPFGLLHGGASVVLAESLGSIAGYLCSEGEQRVVGLEINANHVRAARSGVVKGVCKPIFLGRRQQVWNIEIFNEQGKLCCTSRLTTAVLFD
ncbi:MULTISPECIES: hotdog fold thioesterase [Providencia]|uniref:YdiI family protein n=1 Tax=Providencia heimbachae ATCC 35613 TaxID=1354272 RepID=A0A1B7K234_9GAMM|nr:MULTISPECIES: hotdog fold thioesterase [Providencia]MBP6121116.1 hotdog fold thioesterase [Providencia sp.]MDD9341192.1 hotdog fold thioesterase [Providencia heimbachae]NIH22991.1 hotdog fold thioesterase [Providencia heimbachae]OAT54198.1 YdiI family protein [Providencia heimbachae ATCC 35613]QCJ70427.1 esterase [Providencia heimbachae]